MTKFFPKENESAANAAALGIDIDASYMRMMQELAPRKYRQILWAEIIANLTTRPSPIEIPLAVVLPEGLKKGK